MTDSSTPTSPRTWELTLDFDFKKLHKKDPKTSSQSNCRGRERRAVVAQTPPGRAHPARLFWEMPPGSSPPDKAQPPSWWLLAQDALLIDNQS